DRNPRVVAGTAVLQRPGAAAARDAVSVPARRAPDGGVGRARALPLARPLRGGAAEEPQPVRRRPRLPGAGVERRAQLHVRRAAHGPGAAVEARRAEPAAAGRPLRAGAAARVRGRRLRELLPPAPAGARAAGSRALPVRPFVRTLLRD